MADDVVHTPKFTIRRLSPGPSTPEPEPPPTPRRSPRKAVEEVDGESAKPSPPAEPSPSLAPEPLAAGLFASARSALAFLGSAFNLSTDHRQASVRRTPSGSWWAELSASADQLVELVWAAGGCPYALRDGQWQPATPRARAAGAPLPQPNNWPVLSLGDLLAQVRLPDSSYEPVNQVDLVLPGRLARLALRRAVALGLRAAMAPVTLESLAESGGGTPGAVLLRLRAAKRQTVSRSLLHALGTLPYCAVCTTLGMHESAGHLLVDVRCRLPLPASLIQAMVPAGQAWLLAPADIGHWQFGFPHEFTDCASLLELPDQPAVPLPATPPADLSRPLPVAVVRSPHRNRRVDAVLLDDKELDWLRRYLMTRPLGEDGYLLPGPGRHLLSSPGGLPEALPLGVPLAWVGPHSFFLETGTDFHPPVPPRAREARFQLGPDKVVVLLGNEGFHFDPEKALPLWTLWVGDSPPVLGTISHHGRQLVARVDELLRVHLQQGREPAEPKPGLMGLFRGKQDFSRIVRQAEKAERRGDFARAAELYEKAGQHGPAGRLYERAAMAMDD